MRTGLWIGVLGVALALAGCGRADEGGAGNTAAPVASVAAPQGTRWSETVATTPEGGYRMGNPDAAIKVIEYASFTCPHCRDFAAQADAPLRAGYVDAGKVSFEFRNFIRDPIDLTFAVVARCGGKDVFFGMAEQLFANQEALLNKVQAAGEPALQAASTLPPNQRLVKLGEIAGLIDFAKQRGVPETQVRACLADFGKAEAIAKGNEAASRDFDVQGTPTIIVNGTAQENVATWPQLEARLKQAGA